jgi:hypothetical protein
MYGFCPPLLYVFVFDRTNTRCGLDFLDMHFCFRVAGEAILGIQRYFEEAFKEGCKKLSKMSSKEAFKEAFTEAFQEAVTEMRREALTRSLQALKEADFLNSFRTYSAFPLDAYTGHLH